MYRRVTKREDDDGHSASRVQGRTGRVDEGCEDTGSDL